MLSQSAAAFFAIAIIILFLLNEYRDLDYGVTYRAV
jgi:hypothetical protein